MRVPILTYHSMRVGDNEYANNDLVALAADLELIRSRGLRVLALADLVSLWLQDPHARLPGPTVALSCDDGGDFDFHDVPHPYAGPQRGVLNILRDFHHRHARAAPHVTSFVIVSPAARAELDKTCMVGMRWWNEDWWPLAAASPYMHVGNHSWDHNHEALPESFSHGVERGTFRVIATRPLADAQIRTAADYLARRAPNPGTRLFAYPYGHFNNYLVEEYFPAFAAEIGIDAALGDEPTYLSAESQRWRLPRFVFGRDWSTSEGLARILAGAEG